MTKNAKKNFYSELIPFTKFSSVLSDSHYTPVPEDWYLILTDIRGSTKAIERGQYKQVNMIGAASITCVLNSLGGVEIPYVFGGDGATLLVPSHSLQVITDQLQALQVLAKNDFEIDLRVGIVSVQSLYQQKYQLKVAKYQLSPGNCLAQFRGGAMGRAEEMVKKNLEGAQILEFSAKGLNPSLQGLSCRLNPFQSQKGQILSLICKPRDLSGSDLIVKQILSKLAEILNEDFSSANPVSRKNMRWNWISPTNGDEQKLQKQSAFKILLRNLVANFSIKLNIRLGPFLPKKYKSEMVLNSDFKKFDEMLRMVIDCTDQQSKEIEDLLSSHLKAGDIFYGLHRSNDALMTCMVFSASNNQHIHFIDGGNGGYALAALEMKKQMASL